MSTGREDPERQFNEFVLICIFAVVGVVLTAAAIYFGLEFL